MVSVAILTMTSDSFSELGSEWGYRALLYRAWQSQRKAKTVREILKATRGKRKG